MVAQDTCPLCLSPYEESMLCCDRDSRHRIHPPCFVRYMESIHEHKDAHTDVSEGLPCAYRCGGHYTAMTPQFAIDLFIQERMAQANDDDDNDHRCANNFLRLCGILSFIGVWVAVFAIPR
jgi:hypothetical protein